MTVYNNIYKIANGVNERISLATAGAQFQSDSFLVGASSPEELTKTILTHLIALQNGTDFSVGTNAHTHDGRYFTETELGSATGTSGSDRIGDENTYTNFTPSAATVKGALEGIDAALATSGSTSFADDTFDVHNASDPTKIVVFDISGVATSTSRTLTFPNFNVNLGALTNQNIASGAAIALNKLAALTASRALVSDGSGFVSVSAVTAATLAFLDATSSVQTQIDSKVAKAGDTMSGNLNMGGFKVTSLGAPTAANDAVRKAYVDSLAAGLDFQPDVDAVVANATTTAPGTGLPAASTGQRYILVSGTGSLHASWGTITGVGNNDIVQYDGTNWVVTYDVSVLGEGAIAWDRANDYFVRWDGSTWAEFGGLSGVTAGIGLVKSGNTLNVNLGAGISELPSDEVGIDLYTSAGLFLTEDGTTPSTGTAAQLSIFLNGATLNRSASGLKISTGGVTATELASDSVITVKILDANVTQAKLAAQSVNDAKVDVTSNLYKMISLSQITDADALHYHNVVQHDTLTAGESFASGSVYFGYMADAAGSARLFKATNDRSVSDKYEVFAAVKMTSTITTGNAINTADGNDIYLSGIITFPGTPWAAADVGKPLFLSTAGTWTLTAPDIESSANLAVVRLGHVLGVSKMKFLPQVVARS